jgi:DNA repair exonuclease SbcCD nuclease subunit
VGDQHLDTIDPTNVKRFICEVIRLVKTLSPELVIFMGDMLHYHNTIYIDSLNSALDLIYSVSENTKTFVIVGNHDMKGPTCFLDPYSHWLSPLKKWKTDVTVVDVLKQHTMKNGKVITLLPYVQNGRFREALGKGDMINSSPVDCIFCHQEFEGCQLGPMISKNGDKWSIDSPPIVSGHIHNRQLVGKNIFYTGSSVQTSFGESSDKTISIVHFNKPSNYESDDCVSVGDSIWCVQEKLNMPRKKTYYKTVDQIKVSNILCDVDEGRGRGDEYKLTVKGMEHELKIFKKSKKYKDIIKGGVHVVFKHIQSNVESSSSDNKFISFEEILLSEINKSSMKTELMHIINMLDKKP